MFKAGESEFTRNKTTDELSSMSNCYFSPLHECYLYVEGSGAGDHFKQVVPHHQLTAEQRPQQQDFLMTYDVTA